MGRLALLCIALLIALPLVAATDARVERKPYFGPGAVSKSLPDDPSCPQTFETACFAVLPGERDVVVDVEDTTGEWQAAWLAFYDAHGENLHGSTYTLWCEGGSIRFPTATALVAVYVPTDNGGDCGYRTTLGVSVRTMGEVIAAFS